MFDRVRPFRVEACGVLGRLVRLADVIDEVLTRHAYPPAVAALLGEALAVTAALSASLKFDGVFTLQTSSDGPVSMLVVDITSDGEMRGYAGFDAERLEAGALRGENPVPRLLGAGHLAFTVDQGADTERYQGIVDLIGHNLADCVNHYFQQSEQINSVIRVAVDPGTGKGTNDGAGDGAERGWRAGALMLQQVPAEGGVDGAPAAALEDADDGWRRAVTLLATVTTAEIVDAELGADDLLYRLFHEEGVRVYEARALEMRCRCSRERVGRLMAGLSAAEIEDYKDDDRLVLTCQFCSRAIEFDADDLAGYRIGGGGGHGVSDSETRTEGQE